MKRFALGVGLLVLFLLGGLVGGYCMERHHIPIARDLEEAATLVLAGEGAAGARLARQARQKWERRWHGVAAVSNHGPMDEIDSLFSQAEYYLLAGQTGDFAACCAQLAKLLRANSEAHTFTWWNLL